MNYFKLVFLFVLCLSVNSLFAQGKDTEVIDTPTAYTLGKGTYKFSFLAYDQGGVEFKAFLGLHDMVYLGVSIDVQHAIGKEKAEFNIPGVVGKIKLTEGSESLPLAIALGYDSFYLGNEGFEHNEINELNEMIYGPFWVFTGAIYLFDSIQFLSGGLRIPTQPHYRLNNTSYFVSLDVPLGTFFRFLLETERIYWNFRDNEDWLFNLGLKYNYFDQISFMIGVIFQAHERPNRFFRLGYTAEF